MANKIRVSAYRRKDGTFVRAHRRHKPPGSRAVARTRPNTSYAAYVSAIRPLTAEKVINSQIAQLAQYLTAYGLGGQARQRLITCVGSDAWSQLERRWPAGRCKDLAALADECERLARTGQGRANWGQLTDVPAISSLLRHLNPIGQHLLQAATLLRTTGVIICWAKGRPLRCACFKALVVGFNADTGLVVQAMCAALNALPILPAAR